MASATGSTVNTSSTHLLRSLSIATFLLWLGASSILPLLPEFLSGRGGSDSVIGAVMAAYFVAALMFQYPAGWIADRVGQRPILLLGTVAYAIGSVGFVAPVAPTVDLAFRALQGIGAGMFEVACLAMISASVDSHHRGRAFSSIKGVQLTGVAIGPLLGAAVGVAHMNVLFVAAGACAVIALAAVLANTTPQGRASAPNASAQRISTRALLSERRIVGALCNAVSIGLLFGVYESCWTLLCEAKGARSFQIGLSWTLFALPFAAMSRPGGRMADHMDRRRLVLGSIVLSSCLCALYPFLPNADLLIAFGAIEAVGLAVAFPAVQSLLTQSTDASSTGRVQGLFSTAQTASIAAAAAASGALFGVHVWAPFVVASMISGLVGLGVYIAWRPVVGKVAPSSICTVRDCPAPILQLPNPLP